MSVQVNKSNLDVAILRGDRSLIDGIAAEWDALCRERADADPFSTPTWIRSWLEAFDPGATVVVLLARRDGRLRGVLPLVERKIGLQGRLLTRISSPTNYHSGRIDLVRGCGDEHEVVAAIWETMSRRLRWDILEYRDVTTDSGFVELISAAEKSGCNVIRRETIRSPYIGFDADSDLGTFGPSKQLRRSRRILEKEGEVTLRRTAPADLASLNRLIVQEDAGWKGAAGTAIAREPAASAFYQAVVAAESRSFTAVINELMLDDQPIAINLGLEMGSRYFDPKRTYDEAHHRSGPGHLITHEILLELPTRGISEFDIMGHDEAYKLDWTKTVRQHYHYLVFRPGLKGNLLHRGVELMVPYVKQLRARIANRGNVVGRSGGDAPAKP